MYKLYTIDNTKKSDIKGFWIDKGNIYRDNVFIKDCQDLKELRQGIKELFNKKELACFYIKGNKGYIIDNKGNKTRLNDKKVIYKNKLKISYIKDLLNRYNGLTIYRDKIENYFKIEIYHNKIWNKKQKINKRKKLIKKLYNSYIEKLNIKNLPITLKFTKKSLSFSRVYYNYNTNIPLYSTVNISLDSLKDRVKTGYCNSYYTDRFEKLNFVIGNKHLALRFVLLHELKHSIDRLTIIQDKLDWQNLELNADNFAIEKLIEFKELNLAKYPNICYTINGDKKTC